MEILLILLALILFAGILPLIVPFFIPHIIDKKNSSLNSNLKSKSKLEYLAKTSLILLAVGIFLESILGLTGMFQGVTNKVITFVLFNGFNLSFKIDSLSAFFTFIISLVSLLSLIFSYDYFFKHASSSSSSSSSYIVRSINYFLYSVLTVSMLLVVWANDIFTFIFSWELMGLSSYYLIIYYHQKEETKKGGLYYFIFNHVGSIILIFVFCYFYSLTGVLSFDGIAQIKTLSSVSPEIIEGMFLLMCLAFAMKAGVFPLHVWLPYAHPVAPAHVSALLSGVVIKMGLYGIIRVYLLIGTEYFSAKVGGIILFVGIICALMGGIYTLAQNNIKRLLAYCSVENVGIILMALGMGMLSFSLNNKLIATLAFAGALLHIFNHALFKSLLFLATGAIVKKFHTDSIDKLGGIIKIIPHTGVFFLIGSLAVIGVPPLNGFISEFLIYNSLFRGVAFHDFSFILAVLAILTLATLGMTSFMSFSKAFALTFLGEFRGKEIAEESKSELKSSMYYPLLILSFMCLLMGLFPLFITKLIFNVLDLSFALHALTNHDYALYVARPINYISVALLVLFIIFFLILTVRHYLYKGKVNRQTVTWDCGFEKINPRAQYSGNSFSFSMVDFLRPLILLRENYGKIKEIFAHSTTYQVDVGDLVEDKLIFKVIRFVFYLTKQGIWIEKGTIQLHIFYIAISLFLTVVGFFIFGIK
ncbi:MAG: hypothetical protein HQK51_19685 [Oligoflexia bacterium]|nr:hypothetical protein [Oligoflexia bacterium]